MGRVVLTHSTYLEGLVDWAKRKAKEEGIKTITPGVIGKSKGSVNKLTIRVTRKTNAGFKLVARKGRSYQEIYITSELNLEEIKHILEK